MSDTLDATRQENARRRDAVRALPWQQTAMAANRSEWVVVFARAGDLESLHLAASTAAAATAMGRPVHLFLFWHALERWVAGTLAQAPHPARPELTEAFGPEGFPGPDELFAAARATGLLTTYGCTASAQLLRLAPDRLQAAVDHPVGWATILEATRGVTDRFSY